MDATPTHKTNDDDSSFTLSKEEDTTTAAARFETNSFSVSVKPTPFPQRILLNPTETRLLTKPTLLP